MRLQYKDIDTGKAPAKLEETCTTIQWDYYGYRFYLERDFDTVLDIGANSGTVGLYTHVLFPFADIHSFEPNPFGYSSNVKLRHIFSKLNGRRGAGNWEVHNFGLGDGDPVYLYQEQEGNNRKNIFSNYNDANKPALGAIFAKVEDESDATQVLETRTFPDLLEEAEVDLDKNVSLKIDCECCESFLYTSENLDLLRKFRHVGGEIHYPPINEEGSSLAPGHQFATCDMCTSLEEHKEALNSLTDVFDLKIFKGSRRKGIAHFILTRKDDNIAGHAGVHDRGTV